MPCLEITTMVGCPLMCTFCPQDALKKSYGGGEKYLRSENFTLMLSKVPKYVRIDFSGMSEPWANPECTYMLRHTLDAGYNVAIYTTLIGMINPQEVASLLLSHSDQVETVVLHLPDAKGNMRGYKSSKEFDDALRIFLDARPSRHFRVMTMDDNSEVHSSVNLGSHTFPDLWNGNRRADSLTMSEIGDQTVENSIKIDTPVMCSYTQFYDHNVVLPNGDVVLCCMDYSLKHKIGNLIADDYYSLFSSDEMIRLRASNQRFVTDETICKRCTRATSLDLDPMWRQSWIVQQ